MSPVCSAIKWDGTRCTQSVGSGEHYCHHHDPARASERSRAASKAGKSKPSRELQSLKDQLQDLTDRTLDGGLEPKRAAVAVQALNVKIRALDLEKRWKEVLELEERIERLENDAETQIGRSAWGA